jgi:hypothetical protein
MRREGEYSDYHHFCLSRVKMHPEKYEGVPGRFATTAQEDKYRKTRKELGPLYVKYQADMRAEGKLEPTARDGMNPTFPLYCTR